MAGNITLTNELCNTQFDSTKKHMLGTISRPNQVHTQRPNHVHTTELRYLEKITNEKYYSKQYDEQFDSTMKHKLGTISGPSQEPI